MGAHIDNVEEHLQALFRRENAVDYQVEDYLRSDRRDSMMLIEDGDNNHGSLFLSSPESTESPAWTLTSFGRWQIGQWFQRINADFQFPREFAMISMNYLDRALARSGNHIPQSKEEVQLMAMVCLYLAVKLYQAGPVLSTHQMSMLSGGIYTAEQVSTMEQRLLLKLNWSLHPPCAADFVRPFFMILIRNKGFPPDLCHYDVLELALGMLHTGTLDYYFIAHQLPPSHIAAAALLNAMHAIVPASYRIPSVQSLASQIQQETGCTLHEGQINLCRQRFCSLLESTSLGLCLDCHSPDSSTASLVDHPMTPPPKHVEPLQSIDPTNVITLTPQPSPNYVGQEGW